MNEVSIALVNHPKTYMGQTECATIVGTENEITRVKGLIMCEVLPPQNIYHGVLPMKSNGKLLFPLCRTCCEEEFLGDC